MSEFFQWVVNLIREFRLLVIVLPWEVAVRVRLGNRVKPWGPGWYLKLPFLDHVTVCCSRTRVAHCQQQTVTTRDGKTIALSFSVGFTVRSAAAVLNRLSSPEDTLPAIAASIVAAYVFAKDFVDLNVGDIEARVLERTIAEVDNAVYVEFVRVADFATCRALRLFKDEWQPRASSPERTV